MTQPTPFVCPHLGLDSDRTLARTEPDEWHRCYAQTPPGALDDAQQRAYCLTVGHTGCPHYVAPPAAETLHPAERPRARWLNYLPWAALVAVLLIVGAVYARDLRTPAAVPAGAAGATVQGNMVALAAATAVAAATPTVTPTAYGPAAGGEASTRITTPTAEPGGKVIALAPKRGQAGWWSSGDARGNHLGDSFLYAGHQGQQAFVSAIHFDLRTVPRGAPLRAASLTLMGLQADRFVPDAGGTWSVQLLAPGVLPDPARADFQKLLSAPISVTLVPDLVPADLHAGQANTWALDASARAWLSQQVLNGAPAVVARITGPTGGRDTLFGWDSGAGPASAGSGPTLVLSLGPAPATPPPLPTEQVLVATLTPTPANVMTAAAYALAAADRAAHVGTGTAKAIGIVTPTPQPANVATAQALGRQEGWAPLVIYTAAPANQRTATAYAAYATAVAVTTGTFTPVPTDAVTPVMIMPTPVPGNAATAMIQMQAATAQAERHGPATPLPYGVLIATTTPTRPLVVPTATPGNPATAAAYALEATAVAATTGTFTPTPADAMTPTSEPTATPVPLLVPVTPRPTATPTSAPPAQVPDELRGKILFFSDRDGSGTPQLYAFDPLTGAMTWITRSWPHAAAMVNEGLSPDRKKRAEVQIVTTSSWDARTKKFINVVNTAQIFLHDLEYDKKTRLTKEQRSSYDAAWSPSGHLIAFVSEEPGNDEIFTMQPDGSDMKRLTNNTWEWDKHPTWSPDGKQIVFWSNRVTGRKQLWIMNADGADQRLLLESPYNDWDPVWVK